MHTYQKSFTEVKELNFEELLTFMENMTIINREYAENLLPAFERRVLDLRSDLKTPEQLSSLIRILTKLDSQSDDIWSILTTVCLSCFLSIKDPYIKSDIIRGFGRAKRGNNQVWDFFVSDYLKQKGLHMNNKHLVLKTAFTRASIEERLNSLDLLKMMPWSTLLTKLNKSEWSAFDSETLDDLIYMRDLDEFKDNQQAVDKLIFGQVHVLSPFLASYHSNIFGDYANNAEFDKGSDIVQRKEIKMQQEKEYALEENSTLELSPHV